MSEETKLKTLGLTPFERIVLQGLLPGQASRHEGMLIAQIRETLSLEDDELVKYKVNFEQNGSVTFGDPSQNGSTEATTDTKEFEFAPQKMQIIKKALKDADREGRLPVDEKVHNLFDKVIEVE